MEQVGDAITQALEKELIRNLTPYLASVVVL